MKKKLLSGILVVALLIMCLATIVVHAERPMWNVKPSDVDYYIEMDGSTDVFVCNKETIGSKVGTEYYMTYTVEEIEAEQFRQQGVIGTSNPISNYPYVTEDKNGGIYYYDNTNKMLIEGNTYFIKFVVTEDGYTYKVGWAKDEKSRYLQFKQEIGDVKTGLGYFGVFFADLGMKGKLTNIRFYDKAGNDLGIQTTRNKSLAIGRENPYKKDTAVDHHYTITLTDAYNVAISNKRIPTSDKIYMEYKVESSDSHLNQSGVIQTLTPEAMHPHVNGLLTYKFDTIETNPEKASNGALLEPGAEYWIEIVKQDGFVDITVQKTLNGKTTYLIFPLTAGEFKKDGMFYSLWFGEGEAYKVNCTLTDFKCYDSNKNNLGIQCNTQADIIHYGELEDYSGCEAIYYSDEDASMYTLYQDKTVKSVVGDQVTSGTYEIRDQKIAITTDGQTDEYDFLYAHFTKEDGKRYRRLHTYKVIFETGEGSAVEEQIISTENGYVAARPTEPVSEGNTFVGWYTSDGEEYDFDQVVTESITLFAKWEKEVYTDGTAFELVEYIPHIAIGLGIIALAVAAVSGAMIIRRDKNGNQK